MEVSLHTTNDHWEKEKNLAEQPAEQEKNFSSYSSDKGLIYRIKWKLKKITPKEVICLAYWHVPAAQHRRQEQESGMSPKPLRWGPDLVDYIITPCLKTDKRQTQQHYTDNTGQMNWEV